MDGNAGGDDNFSGRVRQPSESLEEKSGKRQKTGVINAEDIDNSLVSLNYGIPPEEILNTANVLTNMALAQEIAINDDFALQKQAFPENSIQKRISDMLHKAFWDTVSEEIKQTPPKYIKALTVFADIKEILDSLLLPRNRTFREELNENLDLELIKQQAEHGSLDFEKYAKYILSLMARICAPARDERIKELTKLTDTIECYKGIMEMLHLMKIDMVNFKIRVIRPEITNYEKEEFKKFAEQCKPGNGEDKFPFTKEWLKKSMDPNNPNESTVDIMNNAFKEALKDDFINVPETMITHISNFLDIRNKCKRLSVLASIILVTMPAVGSALRDLTDFRKQFKDHVSLLLPELLNEQIIKKSLDNIKEQIIKDSNDFLRKHGFSELTKETESLLAGQINELAESDHKIRQITLDRIHEFLKKCISNKGSSSSNATIPSALASVEQELLILAKQFVRVVAHNLAVFGEYYEEICKSICLNKQV